MYFIILLLIPIIAEAKLDRKQRIKCDGVIFNHVYYDKKLIRNDLGKPYNLLMHKFSGILFFSHTVQNRTNIDFAIMACHVDKQVCIDVKGINGGYAIGYDFGNDDIYFGGHDGIFKYNFLTKSAEYFAEDGKSIWSIFIRRNFYYIGYPSQKLHVYQDDTFVPVAEASNIEIDNFFISKQGDIYYSNKTALYKVDRTGRETTVLDDRCMVRQIVEDMYGDVYFCTSEGIYIEEKPFNRLNMIADIPQAYGITFDDRDHVIYSDEDAVYKLVPSANSNLCYNAIKTHREIDLRAMNKLEKSNYA